MYYEFKGFIPVVDPTSFVHPQAVVVGNVIIGKNVYVGPGAVLRGDWGGIEIKDGCNVQENVVIHMFPGIIVILEPNAHIGHGAIIHGAHIGNNVMIGMNSVIMDHVYVGDNSIVGALTFIKANEQIPSDSIVVGNPGKVVNQVSPEMLAWKTKGTALYQKLPDDCKAYMNPTEALIEMPVNRPSQDVLYETWKKIKDQ